MLTFKSFSLVFFIFFFHSELDEETGIIEDQVILNYFHSMLLTLKQFIYKFWTYLHLIQQFNVLFYTWFV